MRLALIFFLLIFSQIGKGQGFCSHSSGLAFVESSVSPAYNALQNCYDVKFYDLQLEVTDTSTFIRANAGIIFQALSNIDTLVFELSGALTVDSVVFDESPGLDFIQKDGIIFIFPGTTIEAGSIHRSRIFYQGGQSDGGFFFWSDQQEGQYLSKKSDLYIIRAFSGQQLVSCEAEPGR